MHSEYTRIVPGADTAVLFIHGILGTPRHFDALVSLVPEGMTVRNILLAGHGAGASDFSHASMAQWRQQVAAEIHTLAQSHRNVYIAAHSLGTLLALEQAIVGAKVSGLFLLAVPVKLFLKPQMAINSLKVYFNRISPDDGPALAAKACCGVDPGKNPLLCLGWIPRFLELFSQMRQVRKSIRMLRIPCTVCQSYRDEMVSRKSTAFLRKSPWIHVVELENSGHYYYENSDFSLLKDTFGMFLRNPVK